MSQAIRTSSSRMRIAKPRKKMALQHSLTPQVDLESHILDLSPRDQLALANSLLDDSEWEPNDFVKKVMKEYRDNVESK